MWITKGCLVLFVLLVQFCFASSVQFNAVYPVGSNYKSMSIGIIVNGGSEQIFTMTDNQEDFLTHTYTFSSGSTINSLQYRYIVEETGGTTIEESFWRILAPCRTLTVNGDVTTTQYEYFGQEENQLGLAELPYYSWVQTPPPYWDDNQVMSVSFQISQADLDAVIFNPNDEGEIYVKANMTLVSLTERTYVEKMKIRRAGGISLSRSPYSYQIKYDTLTESGEEVEVVIKFKAYPLDYTGSGPGIISEKTAADICLSVGAPINYVSLVRLIINGEYQGLYNMVEKVDEAFVERRWPYQASGNPVGTLYKTQQSHFWLLTNSGWKSGVREFCETQGANTDCCPCVDHNCDINDECDVFDPDDLDCPNYNCCACTWETNGSVDFEFGTCQNQEPFSDYVTLGDSILSKDSSQISAILDADSYSRSLLCALTVMNADGYVFNGKNYYWYRDSVSGKFYLILYDQDTCFTRNEYVNRDWTPWNWTYEGNLADALFLPTIFENQDVLNQYNEIASDFLAGYYRSDKTGPLFARMNRFAEFVVKFNPDRQDVLDGTESFINWFISPLSAKLQSQFGVTQTSITPSSPTVCPVDPL